MMKDKALEELFLAQRPQFDDKDEFMARLTQKLDAVEYLRQYEEANLRRYKYAMLAVFVAGIVVGGALLAFVLSTPSQLPLLTFHASSGILLAIEQYSRTVATIVLSLIMGFGIISIVSNILDIAQMKASTEPASRCR
ncbi:MAG: hypothetical protein MJZ35_04300 [Bacteroidaceae bacterium]|nr:hypothetical protein [Bacteroidaceae bacterium]